MGSRFSSLSIGGQAERVALLFQALRWFISQSHLKTKQKKRKTTQDTGITHIVATPSGLLRTSLAARLLAGQWLGDRCEVQIRERIVSCICFIKSQLKIPFLMFY